MSETQNKELAKSYDPASIEAKWYPFWEQQGYFKAGLEEGKPSFSIQLPPPNITGILHMGHAFNHSVMDSLTPFLSHERLQHDVAAGNRPRRYRNSDRC